MPKSHQRGFFNIGPGPSIPFIVDANGPLACDHCNDESLYHDSHAWVNPDTFHLLCDACYGQLADTLKVDYKETITFH